MSAPMTPAQWKKQLEKFDVPVQYYPGWENRGRPPSKGPFSNVHGVVIHHTGGELYPDNPDQYTKFLFVTGRSDLPAPLCHAEGRADGTIIMGAAKRANHAGLGSSVSLKHTIQETTPYDKELKPSRYNNKTDGNREFYGLEIDYGRSYAGPTPKQYASAVLWAAAICDFHGWTGASVIGHREWTYKKSDPARIKMNEFRRLVNEVIKNVNEDLTPEPEEPSTEKPVPIYPSDLLNLSNAKLTLPVGPKEKPTEIKQPALDTYESKYMYLTPELDAVVFDAPTKGTTTKGSEFTRSETREMQNNGKDLAKWNSGDGYNRIIWAGAVDCKHKVVILQVHDDNDDVVLITVQGKVVKAEFSKGKGKGSTPFILDNNYQTGQPISVSIASGENGFRVRYQRLYGTSTEIVVTRSMAPRKNCYYKYGVYNQVKSGPNGKVRVFRVVILHQD